MSHTQQWLDIATFLICAMNAAEKHSTFHGMHTMCAWWHEITREKGEEKKKVQRISRWLWHSFFSSWSTMNTISDELKCTVTEWVHFCSNTLSRDKACGISSWKAQNKEHFARYVSTFARTVRIRWWFFLRLTKFTTTISTTCLQYEKHGYLITLKIP